MEWEKDGFTISTDKRRLQVRLIHRYLSEESYWVPGIPLDKVRACIRNSRCFGIYLGREQVGFCRIVSDNVRIAWLGDVFVLPEHRGRGLSKWLMECVFEDYEPLGLRRWMLGTRDAHELYRRFGFDAPKNPAAVMFRDVEGDW